MCVCGDISKIEEMCGGWFVLISFGVPSCDIISYLHCPCGIGCTTTITTTTVTVTTTTTTTTTITSTTTVTNSTTSTSSSMYCACYVCSKHYLLYLPWAQSDVCMNTASF